MILIPVSHDSKIHIRHSLTPEIRHQNLFPDGLLLAAAAVYEDRTRCETQNDPVTLSYIEESDREAGWAGWKQEKKCQKPRSA